MEGLALQQLWCLALSLVFFHISEFSLALLVHGRDHVSLASFLLSRDYLVAMFCGIVEHLLEARCLPELKRHCWISLLGLSLILVGELVRKLAIVTAWSGFTHDIKTYGRENHRLVTSGIYSLVRHPGYCGFFVWSIGTQVMMCNPICCVAYALVTWRFFSRRIPYEEFFLRQLFGSRYDSYAQRVPSGIPFVP